jgi:phage shock protein A
MEKRDDDLSGMNTMEAKEYILHHITSLKLIRKEMEELEGKWSKWNVRTEFAYSRGETGLAMEAKREAEKTRALQTKLSGESEELKNAIDRMLQQLPGIIEQEAGSREETDPGTVDPVLLEQELLMASGYLPGDEKNAAVDRAMRKFEADNIVEIEFAKLKAKMEKKNENG